MRKDYQDKLYALLCDIWGYSETMFEEHRSCARMVEFLKEKQIEVVKEDNDRIFPKSNKATTIKNCFDNMISNKVDIRFDASVSSIKWENNEFIVETNSGIYTFDAVVVATGGVTYPTTGSTGDGYKFAKLFDIDTIKPRSSLCGIRLLDIPKELEGTPLNAKLSIVNNGKVVASNIGEFLFTNYGVSGPNVFTLSSKTEEYSINGYKLCFDLLVNDSKECIIDKLKKFSKNNPKKYIFHSVNSLVNIKIAKLILSKCGILENKQCANISNVEYALIADNIKALAFDIENFDSIERATVTRGGVSVKEINPKTMESKKVKNLYFIGEVIDVDALSGGYNLQIAFSTAFACAKYLNDLV